MSKPKVLMYQWIVYVYQGRYEVNGIDESHPKLGEYIYITYTTNRQNAYIENEILYFETKNTMYVCPLKHLNTTNPFSCVAPDYLEELAAMQSDDCVDKIIKSLAEIALVKHTDKKIDYSEYTLYLIDISKNAKTEYLKNKNKYNNTLMKKAKAYKNCIYLEIKNIDNGNLLAYHIGKELGVVEPYIHSGMFQDSILYTKPNIVDFRYFPHYNSLETYSWSDNIEVAVIKNLTDDIISFNNVDIEPNETKVIDKTGHTQGLISPDCVSGKSALLQGELKDDTK